VFDINDLRDKIKNLKIQKAELQQTADNLGREIEVKSSRLREARHERLQVDPDPDLRLRLADTASVLDDTHDIDDQRFRIANEKIEMQILMQEIRGSLPILEREVRHREAIAFHGKKTAAKLTKAVEKSQSLTPTIWNSVEDMKQSLKDAMDLLILSKTTWANILESEKSKNTSLSETVANRRKELARLMRDRDQLRNAIAQIDQQWRSERFRQQLVREEHITLRENLRRFHGGFGFQVCRQFEL
jgi:chromosome segregation ATPase